MSTPVVVDGLARIRWRVVTFAVVCLASGSLAGVLWAALAPRAYYSLGGNLLATLSERSYAEIIGGDAAFTIITASFGLLLGLLAWAWFSKSGRLLVALAVLGASCLTIVAWQLGELIGGAGLTERIATASAGDLIQMDLELRAMSALAAGPFGAITPVMLLAAFLPERYVDVDGDEEPGG